MFRSVQQGGFLPVLQSFGSSPLELWDSKVKFGCIRRVTDDQVRALALELCGTNVSTCYICCPKNPRASLGILMPFFVMVVKNMNRYFTFEITVLDDRNLRRRLRMSNFQKLIQIQHFSASMPLCLEPGWNEIYFDLADITRKAYKTNYMETTRVQIHANCRIRVVYFCDRIYEDKDTPQKLKMFLPTSHDARKKQATESDEPKREAEVAAEAEFEDESDLSEEEAEQMYNYLESVESIEKAMADQLSQSKQESVLAIDERMSLISRVEEEEEEEGEGEEDTFEEDAEENEQEKVVQKEQSIKEEVAADIDAQQQAQAAADHQDDKDNEADIQAAEG